MFKTQLPSMQHLPRKSFRESAAVNFVAENGMAEMMKMHPNLMGSAAVQSAFEQTHFL
jgi:hypothetical protein